ncbi:11284_t:CDS:1, partial [Rhizophagus irregularis]
MRLIVTVKEGVEDIVKPNLIKVDDYYFESLFHKITLDAYRQKNFEIYCRVDEKSSW